MAPQSKLDGWNPPPLPRRRAHGNGGGHNRSIDREGTSGPTIVVAQPCRWSALSSKPGFGSARCSGEKEVVAVVVSREGGGGKGQGTVALLAAAEVRRRRPHGQLIFYEIFPLHLNII